MDCHKCGADNRESRRFCAECGAPILAACPDCGFANEPAEKFCGGCGTSLFNASNASPSTREMEQATSSHAPVEGAPAWARTPNERKPLPCCLPMSRAQLL